MTKTSTATAAHAATFDFTDTGVAAVCSCGWRSAEAISHRTGFAAHAVHVAQATKAHA